MSLLASFKKAFRGRAPSKKGAATPASDSAVAIKTSKRSTERAVVARSGVLTGVLQQPHVTEKSTAMNEEGRYVFRVHPAATKIQVKKAVETLYSVRVASVNVVTVPAKKRRRGRFVGRRSGYKKAVVFLRRGETIEILPH